MNRRLPPTFEGPATWGGEAKSAKKGSEVVTVIL